MTATISLLSDGLYVLREPARSINWLPSELPLPADAGDIRRLRDDENADVRNKATSFDNRNFSAAWNRLKSNLEWQRPLKAFYEGLRLEAQHASFANLAYVAAIEGAGRL